MSSIPSTPSSSSKKLSQRPSDTIGVDSFGHLEDPEQLSCLQEESFDGMLKKQQEASQRRRDALRARIEKADKEREERRKVREKMHREVEANWAEFKEAERVIGAALMTIAIVAVVPPADVAPSNHQSQQQTKNRGSGSRRTDGLQ